MEGVYGRLLFMCYPSFRVFKLTIDYARILPSHTVKATLGHTIAVVKVPTLLELIAQKFENNYLATPL